MGSHGIPSCGVLPWARGQRPPDLRPLGSYSTNCWAGLAWLRERLEKGAGGTGLETVSLGEGPVQKFWKMTAIWVQNVAAESLRGS